MGKNSFKGFSYGGLLYHSEKHQYEFGIDNKEEYQRQAVAFGSIPVGGDIYGGRDGDGNIVRFDIKSKALFVGDPRRQQVVTFFRVKFDQNFSSWKEYMRKNYPDIDIDFR